MYLAVQQVCHAFSGVWSLIAAFVQAFAGFESGISKINTAIETQEKDVTGVSENKKKLKLKLVDKAIEIAGALLAFASDSDNKELKSGVNISRSELENAADSSALNHCRFIFNQAASLQATLADYGLKASDISEFQALISGFEKSIASPRIAITSRKSATNDLVGLFANCDDILKNKMDKLIEKFKVSNPDFYKQYFDARIIIERGLHHSKKEGPSSAGAPAS